MHDTAPSTPATPPQAGTPLHVLLVCPDGTDDARLKQTGTFALSLHACGVAVSVLVGNRDTSPLSGLGGKLRVTHAAPSPWLWTPPLVTEFRQLLASDPTIDIVHLMDVRWPAPLLGPVATRLNVPTVGRLHAEADLTTDGLAFWNSRRALQGLACLRPMVVSTGHLLEQARKVGHTQVCLIPDGVNVDQFRPVLSKRPLRRELGLPEKATLVCCMASLDPANKQLETLHQCMPLGEHVQLVLIGPVRNPDYRDTLKGEAARLGVRDWVHILEPVSNPEDYLKACDLFMLLGGIEERITTVLEAQSAGLPVVLGPSPSALTLTNGNRCGVVLYPNNLLAERAFQRLLSDPIYRQNRSVNARPHVKKDFPFARMMQDYLRLYHSL
jgi:glycosyltransferase involved in cell wall biosynthesis